jgi:hypothetical protein
MKTKKIGVSIILIFLLALVLESNHHNTNNIDIQEEVTSYEVSTETTAGVSSILLNTISKSNDFKLTAGVSDSLFNNLTRGISIEQSTDYVSQSSYEDTIEEVEEIYPVVYETYMVKWTSTRLNARVEPNTECDIVTIFSTNTKLEVLGIVEGGEWYAVDYNGTDVYVYAQYLQDYDRETLTYNYNWTGSTLNTNNGVNYGPSGKETYYNLDMSGVIRIMNNNGYYYDYWVRSDGVKMFGDYIMIAANLSVHPRGSLVETSLGTGIVCDTGDFAYYNPEQVDIAVTW